MTTNKTTMGLLRMKYLKTGQAFMIACCLAAIGMMQSCTKECPPNKEGEDCNIDIVDKFAGTWRGVNDCYVGDNNNINISRINPTQLTITGLFENQLYPLNGTVSFASIEFESGQVLADGVILESASGHLTVEQNLRLYFSYRDETTTELEVVDCRFSGNLLTQNSFEGIPELTTKIVSQLSFSADSTTRIAFSGGIISPSGSTITKRGICWATTSNPTVDSPNKTEDGIGSGEYDSQLYDLVEGTTYYVRAYAVNSAGTGYGNEVVFSVPECIDDLCIGSPYENGTIAYFLQPGDDGYDPNVVHGLVVSVDIADQYEWGCDGFDLGTSSEFGEGANNTNLILAALCSESSNTAAQAARDYSPEVNDTTWYLPSREEFRNIYNNLASNGLGGFNSVFYWTSSESESSPNQNAWMFNNVTGEQMELLSKYNTANVKAVKKF